MKNLTYNDLAALIQSMPEARRADNVSVAVYLGGEDEFLAVSRSEIADEDNGVLDEGHFYLVAAAE